MTAQRGAGRLDGRVALVTGAAQGIGAEIARRFVAEGARVAVCDIDAAAGKALCAELGAMALFIACDVARVQDIRCALQTCEDRFGRLDILVNNAAIQSALDIEHTDEAQWQQIIDVNLKAVFFGIRESIAYLRRCGGGAIINTSSSFALVGSPGYTAYHASKGGVSALTRAAAIALVKYRIRVNAVCPGTTATPGLEAGVRAAFGDHETAMASYAALQPMGRFARAGEIASAYVFLASDEASFVTGENLVVDGGYTVV